MIIYLETESRGGPNPTVGSFSAARSQRPLLQCFSCDNYFFYYLVQLEYVNYSCCYAKYFTILITYLLYNSPIIYLIKGLSQFSIILDSPKVYSISFKFSISQTMRDKFSPTTRKILSNSYLSIGYHSENNSCLLTWNPDLGCFCL